MPAAAACALALVASPLLLAVIARVKALFAGRRGRPLLQPYRDLGRLLRKGAVFSRQTTPLFRLGPIVALATALLALLLVPLGVPAPFAFPADFIVLVAVLALGRFALVLAALDTGSAFEGMGASRELLFGALTEPAVLLVLLVVVRATGRLSLSAMLGEPLGHAWSVQGIALALAALAFFVALLAENSRVPVDDPATHLELTMIHEVMVLDHSGPDLALLEYAASLKLYATSAVLAGLVLPFHPASPWASMALLLAGVLGIAVAVGVVESTMARLRLSRVPQLLVGAGVVAAFALVLALAQGGG